MPTQQSHTFASRTSQHTSQSLQKSVPAQPHRQSDTAARQTTTERRAACNSTYPKGGVSCSKDSFVVNQTLVFQIKFCGKSPALRVAAKRYSEIRFRVFRCNVPALRVRDAKRTSRNTRLVASPQMCKHFADQRQARGR
jgi:hypothetical protein